MNGSSTSNDSQPERTRKPTVPPENLEQIRAELARLSKDPASREQVWQAGHELCKGGFKPGYVAKVLKAETGFGFNIKQLLAPGPAEEKAEEVKAPREVVKAVEKEVAKEIMTEALTNVKTALATGKGLEDSLGPFARLYGFENTNLFVTSMFDFWSTWHKYVGKLVEQNAAYKWAIGEIVRKFTPEGLQALRNAVIKDVTHSVLIAAAQTGNYPPVDTLRQYVEVIREEMNK